MTKKTTSFRFFTRPEYMEKIIDCLPDYCQFEGYAKGQADRQTILYIHVYKFQGNNDLDKFIKESKSWRISL